MEYQIAEYVSKTKILKTPQPPVNKESETSKYKRHIDEAKEVLDYIGEIEASIRKQYPPDEAEDKILAFRQGLIDKGILKGRTW